MGIKERISLLTRPNYNYASGSLITKNGEVEKSFKYQEEYPQAVKNQALLLEELREQKILDIIEDLTGLPVFPLRDSNGDYVVCKPSKSAIDKKRQDELNGNKLGKDWEVEFEPPYLGPDGVMKKDLVLRIINQEHALPVKRYQDGMVDNHKDKVELIYENSGLLTIAGQFPIFCGKIPKEPNERRKILEDSLVKAFVFARKIP